MPPGDGPFAVKYIYILYMYIYKTSYVRKDRGNDRSDGKTRKKK